LIMTRNVKFAMTILLAIVVAGGTTSCKKKGCTDATATNYDSEAEKDDGTCEYPQDETLTSQSDGLASFEGYANNKYTMTADRTYILDGLVFVNEGQTLEIEPGTVIKGKPTTGGVASALVVARGATIIAEGTASNPIIFTAESDDLTSSSDLGPGDVGLWGGVIILGNAEIGVEGSTEAGIEGIDDSETRAKFGGTNNSDNSGTFKYVSIRHCGAELSPGDEIQSLSLGGVGSATDIAYIDVFASSDDGIEIFGGTVDLDHVSIAWAEDDGLDLDNGWKGTCSELFIVQRSDDGDHLGEWDGAKPDANPIYTQATVANATMMGAGDGGKAILIRDGGVVSINNSIIWRQDGVGIEVEDKDEIGVDSYYKIVTDNQGTFNNNTWAIGTGNSLASIIEPTGGTVDSTAAGLQQILTDDGNTVVDASSVGLTYSETADATLDPFSPSVSGGAFTGGNWLQGWSALSTLGYLSE
jgi:hypothetical protein